MRVNEAYNHLQAANTLRFEKRLTDWLFASAGYLYSYLDGSAAFGLNTVLTPYALAPPPTTFVNDKFWFSRQLLLDQQTHVFNLNSQLGPWDGLTFSAALQNEWMRQRGLGYAQLNEGDPTNPLSYLEQAVLLDSNLDRFSVAENFAARYTKIPCTVLYAESRFQQESLGQFAEQRDGLLHNFLQNTDVTGDLKEYRAGFNVSPWQRLALNAYYRRRDKQTDYRHLNDISVFGPIIIPNPGYPAFIRFREMLSDEAAAKLVLRPATWLKTTLSYQIVATDYRSVTDPGPGVTSGGPITGGNHDADIYSANVTVVPWRRLYFATTFSYRNPRTTSSQNGIAAVVPYGGDIYSVLNSANFALTQTTDLRAGYSFSRANYGQDNWIGGLPLGLDYDLHGLQTGLTRRFKKGITAQLQYGFYLYHQPGTRPVYDYTAHAIFTTVAFRWP